MHLLTGISAKGRAVQNHKGVCMRVLSFLLAICFSMNVFATSGGVAALEQAIEEYQYAVTVEWDQKDHAFADKALAEFNYKVEQVFREQAVDQKDVQALLASKIQDKSQLAAVELKIKLLSKNLTPSELSSLLLQNSSSMYHQGASWNEETLNNIWSITVITFLIVGFTLLAANAEKLPNAVCNGQEYWQDQNGRSCYVPAPEGIECHAYCTGEWSY